MTAPTFTIRADAAISWNTRGSCGNAGCADPECCCAVCGKPIGIPESDPRWEGHDEDCSGDCELCCDSVPTVLFRGEGKSMRQAQFHHHCFEGVLA